MKFKWIELDWSIRKGSDGGSISKVGGGGPKAMTRFPSPKTHIQPVHL